MNEAELWWERTYGPSKILEQLKEVQIGERAVVLSFPADFSFLHELRTFVQNEWGMLDDEIEVLFFDCTESRNQDSFDERLAETVAPKEFMRKEGGSVARWIIRKGYLEGRVLWIKGVDEREKSEAIRFAEEYGRKGDKGLVVLELMMQFLPKTGLKIREIAFSINDTDMETYAINLFHQKYDEKEKNFPPYIYRYLSMLTTALCRTDAELASEFVKEYDFWLSEPREVLEEIREGGYLPSQRGQNRFDGQEEHIFYLMEHEPKDIDRLVWRAQIQSVFPVLEDIRRALIDRYYGFWSNCLEEIEVYDMNAGEERERIVSPVGLELAQLKYCLRHACDSSCVNREDYDNMLELPSFRNKLAHLEILTREEICKVFDFAERYKIK